NCPPIVALYDENNEQGFPDKFGSPDAIGYSSNFYNPVATAKYFDSSKENYQVLSNFYAQIDFIPSKLNFKTNYSYSFLSTQGREFTPKHYVSSWQQSATTQLTKNENKYYNYIWDNTLTYNDQWGKHRFGAMAGYSMRQEQWRMFEGKASNVPDGADEYWYIKNGDAAGATVK
ncbi:UNVERIFIED_CONTAM: TonB-dependent receptor, partial [Prevotella sp. 15_C9]